jgi:hypothetical protein
MTNDLKKEKRKKIPYDLRSFKFKRKKYLDIDSYNEGYKQALITQKQEFEKMIDKVFDYKRDINSDTDLIEYYEDKVKELKQKLGDK